jgi:PleD family two-component response regulator
MSALDMARDALPEVPFIFVSGILGEEVAIESFRRGATDYVPQAAFDPVARSGRPRFSGGARENRTQTR